MRYILILFMLVGVANAQFSPTSSRTKFINGIGIGSKDTSAFAANDSMVVTMARDSVMYYKYKGYWRAIGGSTAAYKLIADTLFNNGYTTRVRDRWGLDSLGALKLNVSDTASMLSPYARTSNLPSITGKLNISDTSSMLSPYRRTSTAITQSEVTGLTSALAGKLNISDTATMLSRGWLANRSLDTATALQSRIQTKQPLLTNPITGTGTSGQVAYWNGTSTQTGSSNLQWDNSNLRLVINDLRLTATDITSGLKQVSYYPNSGTNIGASISAIPRGTGFSSALRAQFSLFNTDFIADATNYEFATYRSTSDRFLLASGAAGTGTLRPLVFSSGGVSSPSINTEQFVLFPSGRVGVKTFTDNGVDDMQVNGSLIATTLKATNPLGIAYGGTGSATQNFVDLTTAQTKAGSLTLSNTLFANASGGNIRVGSAAATTANDGGIFTSTDQIYYSNWAANRGFLVNTSTAAVTVLGSGSISAGAGNFSGVINSTVGNSPATFFNASSATTGAKAINISNTGGRLFMGIESSTGNSEVTNAPAYSAYISSIGSNPLVLAANNTVALSIASTGAITASSSITATSFFETSDIRLKNIIKRDGDVAYYTLKSEDKKTVHIGYIAQEKKLTNPDQTQANDKGMLSLNYIEILVQKVRALEKEIEKLKSKRK